MPLSIFTARWHVFAIAKILSYTWISVEVNILQWIRWTCWLDFLVKFAIHGPTHCLPGSMLSMGIFKISWPELSKQPQLLSPESFGGMPLPEYPFWLQKSLHRIASDFGPIFPTLNWWKTMKRIGAIVTPIETRICFLFKPGFVSSFLPATYPMVTEAIHAVKKTNTNKMGSIVSIDEGHGLSPKTKIQRTPAADPKTTKEIITETKKPGIPNSTEYKYLFFICLATVRLWMSCEVQLISAFLGLLMLFARGCLKNIS